MESITLENITCSVCGGHVFNAGAAEKGIYTCLTGKEDGSACNHTMIRCKQCDKIYDESNYGRHGDVFECKECGSVNWPYTDMIRNREEVFNILSGESAKLDAIMAMLRRG